MLELPRDVRGLDAAGFLGALRPTPLGTAPYKLVLAKNAPLWTSQGPIRQGATLEEVAALNLEVFLGELEDMPAGATLSCTAKGLSGERVHLQVGDTWTWTQLHLHVCAILAQCRWDEPPALALFGHTRASGLVPMPEGGELLKELAADHPPPDDLRLEVFSHRLGKGREEDPHPSPALDGRDDPDQARSSQNHSSAPAVCDADEGSIPSVGRPIPKHVIPMMDLPGTTDYKVFSMNINTHTNLKFLCGLQAEVCCYQETRHTYHTVARLARELAVVHHTCLPGSPKTIYATARSRRINPDIGEHGGVLTVLGPALRGRALDQEGAAPSLAKPAWMADGRKTGWPPPGEERASLYTIFIAIPPPTTVRPGSGSTTWLRPPLRTRRSRPMSLP